MSNESDVISEMEARIMYALYVKSRDAEDSPTVQQLADAIGVSNNKAEIHSAVVRLRRKWLLAPESLSLATRVLRSPVAAEALIRLLPNSCSMRPELLLSAIRDLHLKWRDSGAELTDHELEALRDDLIRRDYVAQFPYQGTDAVELTDSVQRELPYLKLLSGIP